MRRLLLSSLVVFFIGWSAMAITQYYCPKCGSTEIEIVCTDPRPPVTMVPMTEMGSGSWTTSTLEMKYTHYRATCKRCGFVHNYSMPH